jgi:hypothetical protein
MINKAIAHRIPNTEYRIPNTEHCFSPFQSRSQPTTPLLTPPPVIRSNPTVPRVPGVPGAHFVRPVISAFGYRLRPVLLPLVASSPRRSAPDLGSGVVIAPAGRELVRLRLSRFGITACGRELVRLPPSSVREVVNRDSVEVLV